MTKLAANLTLLIVGSILTYLVWNDNIEIRLDNNEKNKELNPKFNIDTNSPANQNNTNKSEDVIFETKSFRYEFDNHSNGNTKYKWKYKEQEVKWVEQTTYDKNGEQIGYINKDTKEYKETIFNQNEKKIKKISLINNEPIGIWEYYDSNEELNDSNEKLIGTINFNQDKLSSKILGEWVLEKENHNIKKIFFKDKMLEQWKIDIDSQYWLDFGLDKSRCPLTYGEDICQDKMTYNNHLSFPIEYPTIKSIQDKQHIIVNTSKIEIYGSGIKNKKQRIGKIEENFMNGFYIQLINDSTLRITEKDGNVFEYRKVY